MRTAYMKRIRNVFDCNRIGIMLVAVYKYIFQCTDIVFILLNKFYVFKKHTRQSQNKSAYRFGGDAVVLLKK